MTLRDQDVLLLLDNTTQESLYNAYQKLHPDYTPAECSAWCMRIWKNKTYFVQRANGIKERIEAKRKADLHTITIKTMAKEEPSKPIRAASGDVEELLTKILNEIKMTNVLLSEIAKVKEQ